MDSLSYKTQHLNKASATKEWIVVDAQDAILGRLSSNIAKIIRGKHKASFTPHADTGDNVIVINASKVRMTGKKWTDKQYIRHSGYPGGQRAESPLQLSKRRSSVFIIERAVKGMLPKNRLGRQIFKNLHVFEDANHPYAAQKPKAIKL